MTEDAQIFEAEQADEPAEDKNTVTEEIKVQAEDLIQTINDIIREGTAKRVVVTRNDRVLVDIPLALGIGASVVFAIYMPVLSAIVGVGALLGGCTVRIERDKLLEDDETD